MAASCARKTSSFFGLAKTVAASASAASATAAPRDQRNIQESRAIHHPPLRRVREPQLHDGIEQITVAAPGGCRRAREVLVLRQMRIRVGLERVEAAVG